MQGALELQPHQGAAAHIILAPVVANSTEVQHLWAHRTSEGSMPASNGAIVEVSAPGGVNLQEDKDPCVYESTHGAARQDLPESFGPSVATFVRFSEPGAVLEGCHDEHLLAGFFLLSAGAGRRVMQDILAGPHEP
jgi:hypothetical protein